MAKTQLLALLPRSADDLTRQDPGKRPEAVGSGANRNHVSGVRVWITPLSSPNRKNQQQRLTRAWDAEEGLQENRKKCGRALWCSRAQTGG